MSLRVLVTGGAGFIGSHLVRQLVGRKWSVVVLDNFYSGNLRNLRGLTESDKLRIVKGDVRSEKVIGEASKGVDAVVHLAALIDPAESLHKPVEYNEVNATGTLNVLFACVKRGVRKFVLASSAAVYGDGNPLPLREDYELRPLSPYAASKVSAEYYCRTFHECYDISPVVLRFFNVYGPGQGTNQYAGVITKFVNAGMRGEPLTIFGDGEQTRDFVNVQDVAVAILMALEQKNVGGSVFNVCTGKSLSIDELALMVREVLGKDLKISHVAPREGDILHSYGDPGAAEKVLGFKARVGFKEGLMRFVESLSQHGQ